MSADKTMNTTQSSTASEAHSANMAVVAKRQRLQDVVFHRTTQSFSLLVLIALVGIIVSLFINAWPTFAKFGTHFFVLR